MTARKKTPGRLKRKHRTTAIDLFSGCGGLSLGLKSAGFDVIAAIDNDPLACATYRMNHKDTVLIEKDISKTKPTYLRKRLGLRPGQLDLLAGCPPCQGFSTLRTLNGKKNVKEPMNDLVFQFMKYVRAFRPKAIMMENVPGLAKDSRLEELIRDLNRLGYRCEARVLNAADFGVPQRRARMILIAMKRRTPVFAQQARVSRSVRSAIGALPRAGTGSDPLHDYEVNRAEHVVELIKRIPTNGGSRRDLPESDQLDCHKKCDGFADIYGRMAWEKPAPTITGGCINPSKGRFLHPRQHRAITLREAALLQGFPKRYKFDLSAGRFNAAQMIGNAFPPEFAERHAKVIRKQLVEQ
ncbi:MAG TPA: DNA cytosine methyltransferase [Bryobacteraceae bacterium]|nr:DNA cytosine methyltransferase [Bryobacteraceae bacterium]